MARASNRSGTWITYLPDLEDPPSVKWGGYTFHAYVPEVVTNARLIKKAKENRFFEVYRVAEHSKSPRSAQPDPWRYHAALIMTRNLVVKLLQNVHDAFEGGQPPAESVENLQWRYAAALWSVAMFFQRFSSFAPVPAFSVPLASAPVTPPSQSLTPKSFATKFFELGSEISDISVGARPRLLVQKKGSRRLGASSFEYRAKAHVALGLHARLREADVLKQLGLEDQGRHKRWVELGAEREHTGMTLQRGVANRIVREHKRFAKLAGYKPGSKKNKGLETLIIGWRNSFNSSQANEDGKVIGKSKNWEAVELFEIGKSQIASMTSADDLRNFADLNLAIADEAVSILSRKAETAPSAK
jgi:hypothetical protein